ncbi:hypothetical protein [Mucilaginibacter myungsuensis]|uniref:Uncharacterized protein n=1 Tax=Mucilaginibacter myungsuensis TaxID=649104 RepID=A0A929KXD5_9SPHI|nr:hypothetical protein [Mucilaginibacter myungsuensis]MBE9661688.1 hypothetical protein [Mucilaginibacter myungsuensis]MDN3597832.1 hypothetical protein [Mucilaginibacter myungsuensis]
MFQKDTILNEINKMTLMFARMIGLKADGSFTEFEQQFNHVLQDEYDLEVEQLLALDEDNFKAQLQKNTYSAEKLNGLSQLLYLYAEPFEADDETALLLKKVMVIFDVLETKHHYDSFENIEKRKAIYGYFNTSK